MTTLTITDAKKNLTRWLKAAARGEEIGIVTGADVIALRKVEVDAADYAAREYGATADEVARYEREALAEHARLKRGGKLVYLSHEDLRNQREKAAHR